MSNTVELRATVTYTILTSGGGEKPCTKERSITFSHNSSIVAYSIDGGRELPSLCRSLKDVDALKEAAASLFEKDEQVSSSSIARLKNFTVEWH